MIFIHLTFLRKILRIFQNKTMKYSRSNVIFSCKTTVFKVKSHPDFHMNLVLIIHKTLDTTDASYRAIHLGFFIKNIDNASIKKQRNNIILILINLLKLHTSGYYILNTTQDIRAREITICHMSSFRSLDFPRNRYPPSDFIIRYLQIGKIGMKKNIK